MASTTLVAFLFECSTAVRSVELIGSWDNFTKPYRLKRDSRRGPDFWSGCYTFDNIIFDGDIQSTSDSRDGALRMGGTYWYYYKIDDDDEQHNPSQPSTTFCPLLPGQRLNILEVPMESKSRSNSASAGDYFTRNPQDKYLTPVPPKPLLPPQLGELRSQSYSVSIHAVSPPTSATSQPRSHGASPSRGRRPKLRTAETSPEFTSNASFTDLRSMKEKLAVSKRSASTSRTRNGPQRNVRDLQISAPTLVSTTAKDMNLVPLPSQRTPKTSSSLPARLTPRMGGLSPLGSNPVDRFADFDFGFSNKNESREDVACQRSQSFELPVSSSVSRPTHNRYRANSADTRRTKQYSPVGLPRIPSTKEERRKPAEEITKPVLQRPQNLHPPTEDSRPSSRHGRNPMLDKALPELPRFLTPAPLFTCNENQSPNPEQPDLDDSDSDSDVDIYEPSFELVTNKNPRSHFSMWSVESVRLSLQSSKENAVHSPTYSSLTSNSSTFDESKRPSDNFGHGDQEYGYKREGDACNQCHQGDINSVNPVDSSVFVDSLPLQLGVLPSGPSTPQFLPKKTDGIARPAATYFDFTEGFKGYSLPDDQTASHITMSKASMHPETVTTVNQLAKLMTDFGYLGDSVA